MGIYTKIVKIGNSKGIRIPKTLLEQANLPEEVELIVEDDRLIIQRVTKARDGWAAAFMQMAHAGEDHLLDDDWIENDWDVEDWEW